MTKRSFFTAGTASFIGLLGLAPRASAEHKFSVGHGHSVLNGRAKCGCPIYSRRVCTGYDRNHNPVYSNHREPFVCGCSKHSKHVEAFRKYQERRNKENLRFEEKLQKEYREYQKKLEKAHRWHTEELEKFARDYQKSIRKY